MARLHSYITSNPLRPAVRGKFLFLGDDKLLIRGVTYGPFRPNADGSEYHTPESAARDFTLMRRYGFNAVRTYTVPPSWFLDVAYEHGLWVMVGLPWEQHIAFLDKQEHKESITTRVREAVRACAGHPAILAYTIGNEIPSTIVRWHGRRRVERFLHHLYSVVKAEDAGGLVTYVNYPTTEYLDLPFVDFMSFNVYLEAQDRLEAYLARLQNLAGNKPLLMAEIGLDSRTNGEECQAKTLAWQIRTVFEAGSAGAFVFAWTDEWHRGGFDIEDWDFGLTQRDRTPKPALAAVANEFSQIPIPTVKEWPRVSVVVCTRNGAKTIGECCESLHRLDYPDYEVIIVDDGSTDDTVERIPDYDFRVIRTENRGLSSARNTGLYAATGEIIAYLDDDAYADPHWLTYLVATFLNSDVAGAGGPNISPAGDGWIADCVANSPGGPNHVLLTDRVAEHIPGCNMAFWRARLIAVGGFDTQFRIAGDDVDLCWRLQERGWQLGFSPAAMVWHHRRGSVRGYWKQQLNYGKAEAMLEMKWPEKYNSFGHLSWRGKIYGPPYGLGLLFQRSRIYQGVWGTGLFQSLYGATPGTLAYLPLMPEWYLVIIVLFCFSLLGILWQPLRVAWPIFALLVGLQVAQAVNAASRASFTTLSTKLSDRVRLYTLTAALHIMQPLARLIGRMHYGLTPWRRRGAKRFEWLRPRVHTIWSEEWHSPVERLEAIEAALVAQDAVVLRGGDFDNWDLQVRGGLFGRLRLQMAIEEHGGGKQLVRLRSWPVVSRVGRTTILLFTILSFVALLLGLWSAAIVLALVALLFGLRALGDGAAAAGFYLVALEKLDSTVQPRIPAPDVAHPIAMPPLDESVAD